MVDVSASMVKELREMTGLGMMECKRALAETNGDMKAAEDLLRIKSGSKASKAAGRIAESLHGCSGILLINIRHLHFIPHLQVVSSYFRVYLQVTRYSLHTYPAILKR